jgi:hypothetical protein
MTFAEQAKAFERGVPSARVVRLTHANHYVFKSNEAGVLREMRASSQLCVSRPYKVPLAVGEPIRVNFDSVG